MRTRFSKRLSRFIVFFALLHTMAPSLVSVVDALSERGAVRTIQVGEQGSNNYRSAHPEDCALCAFSIGVTGAGDQRPPLPRVQLARQTPVEYKTAFRPNVARPLASQRAPPVLS